MYVWLCTDSAAPAHAFVEGVQEHDFCRSCVPTPLLDGTASCREKKTRLFRESSHIFLGNFFIFYLRVRYILLGFSG